ncbi:MAG: hypothetical protein IPJ74_08685 [Saprospiraceae bacterium]|nr:hypothetical protein [Saprospiraceae bacterium]
MQNILINDNFKSAVERLRSLLPFLSFGLLIITYLISAVIMGIFISEQAPNKAYEVAAYLIAFAIQTGRGTLVFFFQLNPANIQRKYSFGIIAATVLLILSLLEAGLVLAPVGLSWLISVSTLMIIGWIIEIMLLREAEFATYLEIYQNKERWAELKEFYLAQAELASFIGEIKSPKKMLAPLEKPEILESPEDKSSKLLEELKQLWRELAKALL